MFGTRQQLAKIKLDEIELLDNQIKVSCKVKYLRIIFESDMSMNSQLSHMCQSPSFHFRNVKGIVHLNIIFSYMKVNKICNLDHPVY